MIFKRLSDKQIPTTPKSNERTNERMAGTKSAVTPQELKRQYERDYYQRNKERIKANKQRYWERKAAALNAALDEREDAER